MPKISSKRRPSEARPSRRKARWIGLGLVVAVVIALAVYFFPIIRVASFDVQGANNVDTREIEVASGIQKGENLLRIDTAAAAQRIAAVPWVKKVTVERALPGTVRVDLEEHQPVGVLKIDGEPTLIDKEGVAFLRGVVPKGIVPFEDIENGDQQAMKGATQAVISLDSADRKKLDKVTASDAESITLYFNDDKRIFWGSADRASEKAEATRIVRQREEARWNVSNPAMPTTRK